MFKLTVPITKAKKKANGKLLVAGIASDPTIDRDMERFDSNAVTKMAEHVNAGNIPIRLEHEDKVYTEIGKWTKATVDKDYRLHVEGELDNELSLAKDISILLQRGADMALSVGGRVLDAVYEYSKDLGRNIKVYKDIILDEISVVRNPSNYNAELSLAKSVDWNKLATVSKSEKEAQVPYSSEAEKLITKYRSMVPLSTEQFEDTQKSSSKDSGVNNTQSTVKVSSWADVLDHVVKRVGEHITQSLEALGPEATKKYYEEDEIGGGLSSVDMNTIVQISKFLDEVEIPDAMVMPAELEDYEFVEKLTEEAYIVMPNRRMVLPHHNADLSVNKEFLSYALKSLFDGQGYWKPKEYSIAMNHLYYHLKELSMLKSQKSTKEVKTEDNVEKSSGEHQFSEAEIDLFKNCSAFVSNPAQNERPVIEGQVLTDEQIIKMAKAYDLIKANLNSASMQNTKKNEAEIASTENKEGVTPAEETKVEDTPTTEEKTPETQEETPAEAPVEETPAEETPEETPAEEKPAEETPAEETPAEETPSETPAEETPAEAPAEETPAETPAEETPAEEVDKGKKTYNVKMTEEEYNAWKDKKGKTKKSEDEGEEAPAQPEEVEEKAEEVETPAEEPETTPEPATVEGDDVNKSAGFSKAIDAIQKSVGDLSSQVESIVKSQDDNEKKMNDFVKTVSDYVTARKSVAAYTELEKNFSNAHADSDAVEDLAKKFMEDEGLNFQDAYKKAKAAQAQANS